MSTHNEPIATGRVHSLSLNGKPVDVIDFALDGPIGDDHRGTSRALSGHDGAYIRTSKLTKGDEVFNWRSWTGLSLKELLEVEKDLSKDIPQGCLLENIVFSGIPDFSQLEPTSRIVFPAAESSFGTTQAILAVWEENGPCKTVGERLEEVHNVPGLKTDFIRFAQQKRGVMGFVLSAGTVFVGDTVMVYPPVR